MSLKPRYIDLLDEFRQRRIPFWWGLALLAPTEWNSSPNAEALSARHLLLARMQEDTELAGYCQAAAVGLSEPPLTGDLDKIPSAAEPLLDAAVSLASELDDQLSTLDNHQWQRKLKRGREHVTIAAMVDQTNAAYSDAQLVIDAYLGSYKRLGKAGLKQWLLDVYNEVMDSVAGMTEQELMGEAWYGEWNTYQLMEHIWAWNQQLLAVVKRWQEADLRVEFIDLPELGQFNPYLNAYYRGNDMIAIADGIVTVFRKTCDWIEQSEPALLMSENNYPHSSCGSLSGRGPLCNLIFDCYRHAWDHAQDIRAYRETRG